MTKADSMATFEAYKKWHDWVRPEKIVHEGGLDALSLVLASCWLSAFKEGKKHALKKRGRAKK